MPAFEHKSLDEKGRTKKGIIEGDSAKQIRQKLRDKGWMPLSVEVAHDSKQVTGENRKDRSRLSPAELSLMTRQISTLLQSGLTVEQSLKALTVQNSNKKMKGIALSMRSKITEGHSFAKSLAQFPNAFPDLMVASVEAGERSGHLTEIMGQLADYAENRQETMSVVKQAMIYPIILLVFSIVIVTAMLTFAMPKIVGFAIDSGATLPTLTQMLMNVSDFLASFYGLALLVLILVGTVLFFRALNNTAFKRKWHRFLLRVPLVKKLVLGSDSARLASTLSILGRSNVPMVEAMRISSRVLGNQVLKESVEESADMVEKGSGIGFSLNQSGHFPPILLQIITSGEQSGELDTMLAKAADMQDRELRGTVSTMLAMISPLMLLVLGGLVMIIVLAMMLPMISVFNQL